MNIKIKTRLIGLIALVIYLSVSLLIPFARTAVYYIALGTTLFTLAVVVIILYDFKKSGKLEHILLHYPVVKRALTLLSIQTLFSWALMAICGFCPIWVAALSEIIIIGLGLIRILTVSTAAEVIETGEEAQRTNTASWKQLRSIVASLPAMVSDHGMKKKLIAMSDSFASANPITKDASIDEAIRAQLIELQGILRSENWEAAEEKLKTIQSLLDERKTIR